jgi:DNA-binding NtrC family response regulator
VAATNVDLRARIADGKFREDLFYRLNVVAIKLPPLRQRPDDIPLLAFHFLQKYAARTGRDIRKVSPEAMRLLQSQAWPGNVRELENVIERCVVTGRTQVVGIDDLPTDVRMQHSVGLRPKKERRRTIADELFKKLIDERESFWKIVYPLYMQREITRGNVRDIVRKGLEEARGNYKIVARLFNMEQRDYKRFLNFLRKHDCQLPFKEYRQ